MTTRRPSHVGLFGPTPYGLATQLRTPSEDLSNGLGFTSATTTSTGGGSTHKVTPAMRDDVKRSPTTGSGVPSWSSRSVSARKDVAQIRRETSRPARRTGDSAEAPLDPRQTDNQSKDASPSPRKSLQSRSQSSSRGDHEKDRGKSNSWAPTRPPRPSSPTLHPLPVPPIPASAYNSRPMGAPMQLSKSQHSLPTSHSRLPPDQSYAPLRPLDLGIKLEEGFSTFHASKSSPNLGSPDPDESYKAQVGVATRVARGESLSAAAGRKASVAMIVQAPQGSNAGALPPLPKLEEAPASHLRPPRPSSPNSTNRPIGQGLRSSYAGSVSSIPTPTSYRRSSSMYIPNSSSPPPATTPPALPPSIPVTVKPAPPPQTSTVLSLAKRTSHISTVPGYGWRLHLLEKLEAITGSYLTIHEAEEILSIGNGAEKRAVSRAESRKSQIGLPAAGSWKPPANTKPAQVDKGFFGKMKRGFFSSSHSEHSPTPRETSAPKAAPAKTVFGQPLAAVAEYGFVTSMIANQRHDLPGVCFSTVEEIYRRGQGMKIPGLLHLQGEPARIAKLQEIYDSAPDYGEHHELSIESIHNVCALLKKYLRDLPDPILDQRLWRLYQWSCVDSSATFKQRVACAQIILRLLPAPNFSLLVYLVAFLSQMPLFPENRMSLESVSSIFGPSAMAARARSTASTSKLSKIVSGSMVISGPHDFDPSVSAKKATDGLLWLLTHWSAVADGLLEPDFDVDVDEILERSPQPRSVPAPTKPQPRVPSPPPRPASPDASPPQSPQSALEPPPAREQDTQSAAPSPTSTLEITPHFNRGVHEDFDASSVSPTSASPATVHAASPIIQQADFAPTQPAQPQSLFSERYSIARSLPEDVDAKEVVEQDTSPVLELQGSSSSRSSDSTLESSLSSRGDKTHSAQYADADGNPNKAKGRSDGFARAIPEDQFGPLGPPGTSVLDDLLEHEEPDVARRTEPSLFNFPTPPSDYGFSPKVDNGDSNTGLVRSKAEQFREAQQIQEAQRREIQTLWKQLTDNELARAAERSETESLRQELAALKAAGQDRAEQMAIQRMEARCQEAKKSMDEALEQLRLCQEENEVARREASAEIDSLKSQLNTIRSVLGGGLKA